MSLAANSLHSPIQAEAPNATQQWTDAPPLTTDMLSGTFWSLGDVDRGFFAQFMVLAPGGLIGNYFHPSVDMWQVMAGRLCLVDRDGLPSVIFDLAQMDGDNLLALAGHGVVADVNATYILFPTSHPPHPLFSTPPEVERRATFLARPPAGPRRPYLVVVPANSKSLHPRWFERVDEASRNWDLCIGYYGAEDPEVSNSPYEYLAHLPKRKKFKLLYDLFHEGSPLWNYERIWLPDDDLLCTGEDINRMFHVSQRHGLDLAQPSLKQGPGCYPNHPLTVQRPGGVVRYEGFVEIMCPVFSQRALKICIETMRDVESGYGLDHLWPSFLGRPQARMGIIDAVAVAHTRPLGATYNVKAAVEEQGALFRAYQYTPLKYSGVW
jgi:hypothetical protein